MREFRDLAADAAENFFLNFVREGDVVFDIGANIGQSALLASTLAGAGGRVVSFEPNAACFRGLVTAIGHSGLKNITAVPLALSDHIGHVDFFIDTRDEYTAVASSLTQLDDLVAAGKSRKTTVACTTLDAYCAEHQVFPQVIKIDVESAEPLVIAGGRRVIETRRPTMLFEFWETWWDRGFRELFEYLTPLYRLIRMQDGVDVERYYHRQSARGNVDILCLPRKLPGNPRGPRGQTHRIQKLPPPATGQTGNARRNSGACSVPRYWFARMTSKCGL